MAGICPVAIGTSLAVRDEVQYLPAAACALIGAMAIQIGTNYCNDYCDFFQGADTDDRKGPTRAVQAGLVTPRAMLCATIAAFSIAAVASAYLSMRAGWPIAVLAVLSVLFGVFYTAGRYSLAYLGIADPFVLFFFGPIAVAGTYYVQGMEISVASIVAGIAPGAIATGLLVVNNLRDINEDRLAKKRTLAVRFGETFSRLEYTICISSAAIIPILLWCALGFSPMVCIASLVGIPAGFLLRKVWIVEGAGLNLYLGKTAALLLAYSVVFSMGSLWLW